MTADPERVDTVHSPIADYLQEVLDDLRTDSTGAVAGYIPELAAADPEVLGTAVCTGDERRFMARLTEPKSTAIRPRSSFGPAAGIERFEVCAVTGFVAVYAETCSPPVAAALVESVGGVLFTAGVEDDRVIAVAAGTAFQLGKQRSGDPLTADVGFDIHTLYLCGTTALVVVVAAVTAASHWDFVHVGNEEPAPVFGGELLGRQRRLVCAPVQSLIGAVRGPDHGGCRGGVIRLGAQLYHDRRRGRTVFHTD
nr:hypothetical protein [Nocardia carnea]